MKPAEHKVTIYGDIDDRKESSDPEPRQVPQGHLSENEHPSFQKITCTMEQLTRTKSQILRHLVSGNEPKELDKAQVQFQVG